MIKKIYSIQTKKNQIQSFPAHVVFTISYYPIAIKYLLHYKKKRFRKKNLPFFYPKTKYFPHPLQKNKQCRWKNAFFLLPFCLYFAPNIIYYTTKTKHQIILVKLTTIYEKKPEKRQSEKKKWNKKMKNKKKQSSHFF